MCKLFIWIMALALIAPAAHAQRPPEAVAQDGSDAPPLANEFGPQASIADNVNTSVGGGLRYTDPNGVPGTGAPDNVGAFRFLCAPSHVLADDGIVNPGKPGEAHIHMFFGNTGANAFSTYESLRTTGKSTCVNEMWRSAYWIPAMLDGPGADAKVVWPSLLSVYYKRYPKTSPFCTPGDPKFVGRCIALPNGLKAIANYDMVTGTSPSGRAAYKCIMYYDGNSSGISSEFVSDMVTALSQCRTADVPAGATNVRRVLDLLQDMPQCWNGTTLDSPNHRSHIADTIKVVGVGEFCPKTHPYFWPGYSAQVQYVLDDKVNTSGTWTAGQATWYCSSDRMPGRPIVRPCSTNHFDLWDASSPVAKKISTDNCIDKLLSCSAGVLGDGTGMQPDAAFPVGIIRTKTVRPKMNKEAASGHIHGPR